MSSNNINTEMKNREGFLVKVIAICGFSLIFSLCTFLAANKWNPDSDVYWLIETGRWIWEHKTVPKANPWTQMENLSVIVQQPLCALFNYWTYAISGSLSYMWVLAMIQNVVMLVCFGLLGKKIFAKFYPVNERTPKQNRIIIAQIFSTLTITEVLCGTWNMITTRPYQITIATTVLLLCSLETHTQKENYGKLALKVGLLTLWQANFQMASLIFIPFVLFLYMVGNAVEKLKNHTLLKQSNVLKWAGVYVTWALVSLINPYGLKGALYLCKASSAVALFKDFIQELASPPMVSLCCILIVVICFMILNLAKRNAITTSHILLCIGASILTGYAIRNCWLVIVAFIMLFFIYKAKRLEPAENPIIKKLKQIYKAFICSLPSKYAFLMFEQKTINENKKSTRIFEKTLCILSFGLSFVIIASNSYVPNQKYEEAQQYINIITELPEDALIYTDFNTGGIVEFCQRKCYIDARPELYSPAITGSETDLLTEYKNFDVHGANNYEEQIKGMNYDYYFLRKNSLFQYFLRYGHHAEIIQESDNYVLYGRIK